MATLWHRAAAAARILAVATSFLMLPGAPAVAATEGCLECHGLPGLSLPGRALWLTEQEHAGGVHGRLTCSDCHKGAESYPHKAPQVRCDLPCHVPGATHEAVVRAEVRSVHARQGPVCGGCHTAGNVPRGPEVRDLCLACHQGMEVRGRTFPDSPGAFGFWAHRRIPEGRRAPSCPDCHGVHGIAEASKARDACGASGCHPGADLTFGRLFDHGGPADRPPWGGAAPAALALGALILGVAALHAVRRP